MSSIPLTNKQEFDEFINIFPILKKDIIDSLKEKKMNDDIINWISLSFDVNPIGGKYMRGLTVLNTIKDIKGGEIDEDTKFLGRVVGWCIEFLQASLVIADDIMDGGIMRRDKPCWYRMLNPITQEGTIGTIAVNDAFIMESCVYIILKKYCSGKPYYIQMIELFNKIRHNTYLGQLIDTSACHLIKGDFSTFNLKNFYHTVRYKTSYYTFYIPVALGLLISGEDYLLSKYDSMFELLLVIGEYMNAQDDYLDCYGDPKEMGKVGTDIEENKRSWLICTALQYASQDEIEILKQNYGINNIENVNIVKSIYNQLGMKDLYKKYEDEQYKELLKRIENEDVIQKIILTRLLNRCYKRNR